MLLQQLVGQLIESVKEHDSRITAIVLAILLAWFLQKILKEWKIFEEKELEYIERLIERESINDKNRKLCVHIYNQKIRKKLYTYQDAIRLDNAIMNCHDLLKPKIPWKTFVQAKIHLKEIDGKLTVEIKWSSQCISLFFRLIQLSSIAIVFFLIGTSILLPIISFDYYSSWLTSMIYLFTFSFMLIAIFVESFILPVLAAEKIQKALLARSQGEANEDLSPFALLVFVKQRYSIISSSIRKVLNLQKRDKTSHARQADERDETSEETERAENDPILVEFLNFLARDIANNPQRIRTLDNSFVNRIQSLVSDVDINLDNPLSSEDE